MPCTGVIGKLGPINLDNVILQGLLLKMKVMHLKFQNKGCTISIFKKAVVEGKVLAGRISVQRVNVKPAVGKWKGRFDPNPV